MVQLSIRRHFNWILLGVVYAISISLWMASISGSIDSMYQFFPILGILAWTTMWVQYVVATAMRFGATSSSRFTKWTGRIVLLLIIMHPSIFLVQRFIDTGLLPPASYISYVGSLRAWAISIAVAALATFLLYGILKQFRRKLITRGVWAYISLLQAVAMIAIFTHALAVGTSTSFDYFAVWWWLLGIVLVPCLLLQIIRDFKVSFTRKT